MSGPPQLDPDLMQEGVFPHPSIDGDALTAKPVQEPKHHVGVDDATAQDLSPYSCPSGFVHSAVNLEKEPVGVIDQHNDIDHAFVVEATCVFTFDQTLLAATSWNDGNGMFDSFQVKLEGPLRLSYDLYLYFLKEGEPAVKQALKSPYFALRVRMPRKLKPALIAVQVVAKPVEQTDGNACYTYAKLLESAAANKIMPDDFAAWAAKTTLKATRGRDAKPRGPSPPADIHADAAALMQNDAESMGIAARKDGHFTFLGTDPYGHLKPHNNGGGTYAVAWSESGQAVITLTSFSTAQQY